VVGFLRDVCEPYLSIFRRFIPPIGALDLSPLIGILLLQFAGRLVRAVIAG
jgi:YggT family protein